MFMLVHQFNLGTLGYVWNFISNNIENLFVLVCFKSERIGAREVLDNWLKKNTLYSLNTTFTENADETD